MNSSSDPWRKRWQNVRDVILSESPDRRRTNRSVKASRKKSGGKYIYIYIRPRSRFYRLSFASVNNSSKLLSGEKSSPPGSRIVSWMREQTMTIRGWNNNNKLVEPSLKLMTNPKFLKLITIIILITEEGTAGITQHRRWARSQPLEDAILCKT